MIVHFTECKPNSTIASARIAKYLQVMFSEELYDRKGAHEIKTYDRLIIVNGPFAFCDFLEEIGQLVTLAKEVVWVQNDYAIMPPGAISKAESPFRKAFADRKLRPNFWTTVKKHVKTSDDVYVNWNALTYSKPLPRTVIFEDGIYYHGAFRQGRVESFEQFFKTDLYRVNIDTTGKQRRDKFKALCPNVQFVNAYGNLIERINQHQLALYLEDEKSHKEFHSPANRFYEYVSAGIPIAFDVRSKRMLLEAGIPIKDNWCVGTQNNVIRTLYECESIFEEQKVLIKDYKAELDNVVRRLK